MGSETLYSLKTRQYMEDLRKECPNQFEDPTSCLGFELNIRWAKGDNAPFYMALKAHVRRHFKKCKRVSIEPLEPGHPDIPADIPAPTHGAVICRICVLL